MTAERTVEGGSASAQIVGVIASGEDLQRAQRMRRRPDLFELRLDALAPQVATLSDAIARLGEPLIITARHPAEGGLHDLSWQQRRELLLRFLPRAAYVDVELRSTARLHGVLEAAVKLKVRRILSVHDFRRMPSAPRLRELARAAEEFGADLFKVAVRTETPAELERLVAFFDEIKRRMGVSAMGVGTLARIARTTLARRGSALNYVHLGKAQTEGQLSFSEMTRVLKP